MNHQDVLKNLKQNRVNNLNKVIIGHLNVNSYSGKFDAINHLIQGNVEIMLITETKLEYSYLISQFLIPAT